MLKILWKARPRGGHLVTCLNRQGGRDLHLIKDCRLARFVGCLIGLFSSGCGNVANEVLSNRPGARGGIIRLRVSGRLLTAGQLGAGPVLPVLN